MKNLIVIQSEVLSDRSKVWSVMVGNGGATIDVASEDHARKMADAIAEAVRNYSVGGECEVILDI